MPPAPKLIGVIPLPFPRIRKLDGGVTEYIGHVAFDSDGGAWGLVMSRTPIPTGGAARLDFVRFVRWVRFEAIPFVPDEIVTDDGWIVTEPVDARR